MMHFSPRNSVEELILMMLKSICVSVLYKHSVPTDITVIPHVCTTALLWEKLNKNFARTALNAVAMERRLQCGLTQLNILTKLWDPWTQSESQEMAESSMDPSRAPLNYGNHVMLIFAMVDTSQTNMDTWQQCSSHTQLDVGDQVAQHTRSYLNAPTTQDNAVLETWWLKDSPLWSF